MVGRTGSKGLARRSAGRRTREGGFTLIEVLVAVVLVAIVVALTGPAFARAGRQERVERCAANLKALHAAQLGYYGKAGPAVPELGSASWAALAKTTPPLVQPETLRCPVEPDENAPPIQYLGPVVDPRTLVKDDPIGCDMGGNHSAHGREGGNILLRSGAVVNDNHMDEQALWSIALGKSCRR